MPVTCPHCSREFKGSSINSRHKAVCDGWPKTPPPPPCLCGHEASSLTQMKRHRRECETWQNRDKKAVAAQRRKETNLTRYGVEDASQAPEVRARRAATNEARYGAANVFSKESSVFEKVQASLDGKRPVLKGEDNPFAKPEVQEKIKATMVERYGAENPQQVPEIREKTRATNIDRYGGELLSSPEIRAKAEETNLERYGAAFAGGTPEVQAKVIETNMARYGVPHTCMDPEVRAKQLETMEANYGGHFFASEEGKAKVRAALLENHGVEFPGAIEGHWDKVVATFRERLGVDHPLQLIEYLEKRKETTLDRWGVEHVLQNPEVAARLVSTCQERYGSDHFLGSESYKEWSRREYGFDHPMKNREYARKHLERMGAGAPGPNGLEQKLHTLAPNPDALLFTGDRQWWRWLPKLGHHKNPDFIVPGPDPAHPKRGVTKVVEAFGDFWHSRMFTGKANFAHEQELVEAFAEIGITCLVVWESEVKSDPDGVRSRLAAFLEEP